MSPTTMIGSETMQRQWLNLFAIGGSFLLGLVATNLLSEPKSTQSEATATENLSPVNGTSARASVVPESSIAIHNSSTDAEQ
jgi:hypothetical protein